MARGARSTQRAIAGWSIAKRRQGLLAVAVATHGRHRDLTLQCKADGCGERMDITLDLRDFAADWRASQVPLGETGRMLRLPTAADLEGWSGDQAALALGLLDGPPPEGEAWLDAVDQALSEADPLGDLELQTICPECGAPLAQAHALEPALMAELAGEMGRVVDEIHVLAMAYHWSEAEILALPAARRAQYLDRIREAWAA